ncbi:MAG: homoserine O-succinyltransferase [Rhodobacteraceae bacterium]|nr:homoserine O-succinyltransferase [Paracoccaceae bacterium]
MPIRIPADLPAYEVLEREGVQVMSEETALRQDIRPLQIGLLNLMPKKVQTETQFARLIGATPLQIDLTLIRMSEHQAKTTAAAHLEAFYQPFAQARARRFDGLIITGAPIEHLEYEAVSYWPELREVFDWTQTHVHRTLGVCWGGMAMLHHFHGVPKHQLPGKAFGCFRHRAVNTASPWLQGFSDSFMVPVSRWTEVRSEDVGLHPDLAVLIDSDEVGPCLIADARHRALAMFNHLEYDSTTLKEEYDRDVAAGGEVAAPANYFPGDDPTRSPENRWRSHGALLYGNWINEIYQTTPYDLAQIGA